MRGSCQGFFIKYNTMTANYNKNSSLSTIELLPIDSKQFLPVSLFKGCRGNTKRLKSTQLGKLIESITNPDKEEFIALSKELARLKKEDPGKYKELKETQCPAFIPGDFDSRTNEGCKKYAPLMGFDIDAVKDEVSVMFTLEACKKLPYVFVASPSPSRLGLRILVWTDSTPENHKDYYKAITEKLSNDLHIKTDKAQTEHIDTKTNNISRIWFFTHVPKDMLYVNWESEVFKLEQEPQEKDHTPPHTHRGKYKNEFTNDEKVNNIISQIEANAFDLTEGVQEWFKKILLPLANEYGEAGRLLAHRISKFHTDYKERETDEEYSRALSKDKGIVKIGTFLNYAMDKGIKLNPVQIMEARQSLPKLTITKEKPKEILPVKPSKKAFYKFFAVVKDGKEIKINYLELVELLKKLGFRRYDIDGEFFIVEIKDNVVRECTKQQVIDKFENYISSFEEEELPDGITKGKLLNKIYSSIGTYFSDHLLGRLRPDKPIQFNEHQKNKAFFYYRNGYIEVTKEGLNLKPYSDLKKCIWENQILQRDFKLVDASKYAKFSFVRFVQNIANCWELHPYSKRKNQQLDLTRIDSFRTIIGYLLHSFFDRELKAVLFTDSRISEDNEANGRSGKTLLLKSLGYVLNRDFKKSKTYVELNGKDFDTSKQFKYQELGLDSKLIHLNDIKRNFKIEDLFNDITEGIKRERKNEAPSIIKTKVAISTNLTIKINGSSAKGRCVEIELSDYYDENWMPNKEFGEWFFSDWTESQWYMFDSFMMDCVKIYLQKGIIQPDTINLHERKKVEETSREFVEWMEDKAKEFNNEEFANQIDSKAYWWDKKLLYEEFKERYSDFSWLYQKTFTRWLILYCKYDSGYEEVIKETHERRSDGKQLIKIKTTT